MSAPTYTNHLYPIEIVARAVWLSFRFNLSLREEMRRWCRKHGPDYARRIRREAPTKTMSGTSTKVRHEGAKEEL
ncbi:hypothetical protein BPNPMPFG_008020 (plasmid) [Mesorhizobium sp. AR07]|uniref:hypothetical protein n=1 Tax=Mesorhizobium sp. AR07 TaxID=2865838 RepID=UPI00220994E8|nr:hypothetical protein BPNPMPFG_008020 [Mesorhizobium sp. AR07]